MLVKSATAKANPTSRVGLRAQKLEKGSKSVLVLKIKDAKLDKTYSINVHKDSNVADVTDELKQIYLSNGEIFLTNSKHFNTRWQPGMKISYAFSSGMVTSEIYMFTRGAIYNKELKPTEWNPIKKEKPKIGSSVSMHIVAAAKSSTLTKEPKAGSSVGSMPTAPVSKPPSVAAPSSSKAPNVAESARYSAPAAPAARAQMPAPANKGKQASSMPPQPPKPTSARPVHAPIPKEPPPHAAVYKQPTNSSKSSSSKAGLMNKLSKIFL